ncbi:MAG: helix-turn-helix domain-containing protein [Planctomycetota bacterium]
MDTTSRFQTYSPSGPISSFVDLLWHVDGSAPAPKRELVLPSASVEMVIALHDAPYRLLDAKGDRVIASTFGGVVCGLRTSPVVLDLDFAHRDMGVHFKPGGAAVVLGFPVDELSAVHIDFTDVLGPQAGALRVELGDLPTARERFVCLEKFLTRRLLERRSANLDCRVVHSAIERCAQSRGQCDITRISKELGWSTKKLRSRFAAQVGTSPKRFCRIVRMESMLHRLESSLILGTGAGLAAEFGYFDQSHMIRDFRSLTGMTPTEYQRWDGKNFNHLPL